MNGALVTARLYPVVNVSLELERLVVFLGAAISLATPAQDDTEKEQIVKTLGSIQGVLADCAEALTNAIKEGSILDGKSTADHYRSEITLQSVKDAARIRRKIKKFQKEVIDNEDVINDPLKVAVELDQKEKVRARDIRPAEDSQPATVKEVQP